MLSDLIAIDYSPVIIVTEGIYWSRRFYAFSIAYRSTSANDMTSRSQNTILGDVTVEENKFCYGRMLVVIIS